MSSAMSRAGFRARVAGMVFNTPLLVHPAKADILLRAFVPELFGAQSIVVNATEIDEVTPPEFHAGILGKSGEFFADWTRDQLVRRTTNGVGVIAIEGTLVHKGGSIGSYSGETSYQGLMAQIVEARQDPSIRGVVFEVDSFGGAVSGIDDLAAEMRALSDEKPTIAICTDHAYSAAYWLACQCRQVVIPSAGGVGSIGVIWMHTNFEQALEKAGIEVSILTAGINKADGNPYQALPDAVREEIIGELDVVRHQFAKGVAAGRGKRFTARQALATEAKCFPGEAAVAAGLADAVARPSEAYQAFVSAF
ncbi:MAG: S49 family peptidase [bacterium]|nr:S49 family peptidase [bacterium]